MKILLLDHPQFTSGTYYLWHGLKELERDFSGKLQVILYPYIPTHYDDDSFMLEEMDWFKWLGKLVEEKKLPSGIPPFHPTETLTYSGQNRINRYGYGAKFPKLDVMRSEEEVAALIDSGKVKFIVLGNSHRVPTILLARLRDRFPNKMPPIIYLDAGERDELNEHWIHVFKPALTFKQILTPAVKRHGLTSPIPNYSFKIFPLPLSSIMVDQADAHVGSLSLKDLRIHSLLAPKANQVFWAMGDTWPERAAVRSAVAEVIQRRNLPWIGPCHFDSYNVALAMSRMGISMRGSGRDTTRYWEIPTFKTALIADGTMGCIHPHPFEDKKTALFYKTPQEAAKIVEDHLFENGPPAEEIDRVAKAGMRHLETYHTTQARAIFFLDRVTEHLGIGRKVAPEITQWKQKKGWKDGPWEGPVV